MNKFLKIAIVVVLCLIVILTVTLFACQHQGENPGTTTQPENPNPPACTEHTDADNDNKCDNCGTNIETPVTPPECTEHKDTNGDNECDNCGANVETPVTPPECTEHKDTNSDNKCDNCGTKVETPVTPPECTEHKDTNGDNKCDNCGTKVETPDTPQPSTLPADFVKDEGKVYVIANSIKVRKTPLVPDDEESNIYTYKQYGVEFKKVGYNDSWTAIEIDGTYYYVSSHYVSENKPITDDDMTAINGTLGETAYVVDVTTLRVRATTSFSNNVIALVYKGDSLVKLAVADFKDADGVLWAKVTLEYNGETIVGYVNDKYLSYTLEDEVIDPDMGINFTSNTDIVVVVSENLNLRKYAIYKDPEIDDTPKTAVTKGTILNRLGIATEEDANGIRWSKVLYNGEIYYVSTKEIYIQVVQVGEIVDIPQTFYETLEITLPSNFLPIASEEGYLLTNFANGAYIGVNFSGDILNQNFHSEEEFIAYLKAMVGHQDAIDYIRKGIMYFEYEETINGVTSYNMVAIINIVRSGIFEYYTFTFAENGTKDELQSKFFTYMDSIRIVTSGEPKVFDMLFDGKFSITLPHDFRIQSYDSINNAYNITNGVAAANISHIADIGELTLEELASITASQLQVPVQSKEGISYLEYDIEFEYEGNTINTHYLTVFLAGKGNDCYVVTIGDVGTEETLSSDFWTCIGTIVIK